MSNALLLCAGRGERLRPLTDERPKPLIEVGGSPLIERHLGRLREAGVGRVVINLGWLGGEIARHIGDGSRFGIPVVYSPEGYPPLDSGGAIVRALPWLGAEPFWVVNADIYTEFAYPASASDWLTGAAAAIGLVPTPAYAARGDFANVAGLAHNDGAGLRTFSGIAAYSPAFFAGVADGRFSVVPMLRASADRGALAAIDIEDAWFDTGTPQRLALAREHAARR